MTETNETAVSTNNAENTENTATIPQEETEVTVPIKYNKELRELDIKTAAELAQKGMKYEAIAKDYETLKTLAREENQTVPQFLKGLKTARLEQRKNYLTEKCGGDSLLAEHIATLEAKSDGFDNGFAELNTLFPEFKTETELPNEVLENANAKGTLLLDEYLRYLLLKTRAENAAVLSEKEAKNQSLGSQISRHESENPEAEEFLKGLWK